ncbi:MAG: alkaline phosphatase family protein [Solirubrobacteraceae bacterium]|nr:alkaline phosphatase family protein [Solirubrobacteraceae bacterium]
MPQLLLGPLLRYVGETEATLWVETSAPCTVAVLGHEAPTFTVLGHHYALVVVQGLEPGSSSEYTVELDGNEVWPLPGGSYGPSVLRTGGHPEPLKVVFGSCRVSSPDEPPFTHTREEHSHGREVDALAGLVNRMHATPQHSWPDLLLLVGDQVYADILSPAVHERVSARRGEQSPDTLSEATGEIAPENQVADFEEYTWLYNESWQDESLRWLLSTVSTAMIFDDHDVHDDWNTSAAWVADMRRRPWWRERLVGGYATYWIYQHLGNCSPAELEHDALWRLVREGGDHTGAVLDFAGRAADEVAGTRWSYRRDFGRTRLIVLDSRAGRQLKEGERTMLSEDEMQWVEEQVREGGYDDLLLATSLPWLMAPALHHLEAWNEAVCAGAWGKRMRGPAEWVRQVVDLEHWAAFGRSFARLTDLIGETASGPDAPRTIAVLSGDVHHAYVAKASFPGRSGVRSEVIQAVCSPLRNPLSKKERMIVGMLHSHVAGLIGRALSRLARARRPRVRWGFTQKPTFDNQVATLVVAPGGVRLDIEKTIPADWEHPILHESISWHGQAQQA